MKLALYTLEGRDSYAYKDCQRKKQILCLHIPQRPHPAPTITPYASLCAALAWKRLLMYRKPLNNKYAGFPITWIAKNSSIAAESQKLCTYTSKEKRPIASFCSITHSDFGKKRHSRYRHEILQCSLQNLSRDDKKVVRKAQVLQLLEKEGPSALT